MKILIMSDHPILRDGITALLRQDNDKVIVRHAHDVDEAATTLKSDGDLDTVIFDIQRNGINDLNSLSSITHSREDIRIIVLSPSEKPEDVRAAFAQGAFGYVPTSADTHTLLSAVKMVLTGELYVPPLLLKRAAPLFSQVSQLTPRQLDILRCLGDGMPTKVISRTLGISEKTVKTHITAIFKALKVRNRTQAATVGRLAGLI
ncbi:two component LuxR family transcriptional regulator [Burkholderia lata]|uniref:LuxR C-terminal-related transcriptional regulator n=2 Tax=Burkholderia TaxID=32008 RepID=UPI001454A085|nr:response regulator transcription factor [Burkholderia lata]MBN3771908.1 response regulator transcription factor [Burkholderia sp. Se-20378]MBN3793665.1 response regulator transcription factor [Burkholderia sp. Ac-20392]VWB70644.1 two component LuxR family transcriptional regulator [Burkholderia lata]